MRTSLLILVLIIVAGCAGRSGNPAVPKDAGTTPGIANTARVADQGPYRLWLQGMIYFNAEHDKVDVVPNRECRFHLNALKFLENYCSDCFQVTGIQNNGDSTIDLTVKIKHPFPGFPQYTGFDVKGILMFNGSWVHESDYLLELYPTPYRVSWRKLGDPQVMNADGYSVHWSPWYDSGSVLPIFNYYRGKYAIGTPTGTVNAYRNFYTNENRHMFETGKEDTRTYHIWMPPGQPVMAGYAVEACWEPPTKMPVTDPETDFPTTANQPEAYEFYFNVNNGQPITDPDCCGNNYDPSTAFMYSKQWGGFTATSFAFFTDFDYDLGSWIKPCGDQWPDECCFHMLHAKYFADGDYIGVAANWGPEDSDPPYTYNTAFTVFEFTVHLN